MSNTAYLLSLVNVLLLVTGQMLWKHGITQIGEISLQSAGKIILSPYIWLGLVLYGIATLLWFKVISIAPFSIAYPLQSTAYILGILLAWIIFGESIPWTRWAGSAVIILGVMLVSLK